MSIGSVTTDAESKSHSLRDTEYGLIKLLERNDNSGLLLWFLTVMNALTKLLFVISLILSVSAVPTEIAPRSISQSLMDNFERFVQFASGAAWSSLPGVSNEIRLSRRHHDPDFSVQRRIKAARDNRAGVFRHDRAR